VFARLVRFPLKLLEKETSELLPRQIYLFKRRSCVGDMGRKQKVHGTAKVSTSKQDGVTSDTVRSAAAPGSAGLGKCDVALLS